MVTLEEYLAAREERNQARAWLEEFARRLERLSTILRDPRGVRLNEPTADTGPVPSHVAVDRSDLVTWEQLAPVIQAFTRADDTFRRVEAELTPEQRRRLGG